MRLTVAIDGSAAAGKGTIVRPIATSFPEFMALMRGLGAEIEGRP